METPPPARRLLRPVDLAVVGFVLLAGAFWVSLSSLYGPVPRSQEWLSTGLALAALACHVAAVGLSLYEWRARGGLPGVALFYGALAVVGVAWAGVERVRERQWYRDNPGVFSAEPAGDGLDVRDAQGVWHVALTACPDAPGPSDGLGTRQHDGTVEVMGRNDVPFMRLHVAERRVECLPAGAAR